jgi:hypothetical protein
MNNQTQEALKMAIEALAEFEWIKDSKYQKAINACKKALEQPTQNPIFWMHEVKEAPFEGHQVTVSPEQDDYYTIPIYTHPHQWQGNKDEKL